MGCRDKNPSWYLMGSPMLVAYRINSLECFAASQNTETLLRRRIMIETTSSTIGGGGGDVTYLSTF